MKKNNNKGFTLAELLIVVAIIAVLVAIAVPVFTTQLEKSRESTDIANIRSAYAEAVAEYLGNGGQTAVTKNVTVMQKDTSSWAIGNEQAVLHTRNNGVESVVNIALPSGALYYVHVSATGDVTVDNSSS